MATYLSIDLDYWGMQNLPGMRRFVKKAFALGKPTCLVLSHETLLKHTRRFDFNRLINVDYHSDLSAKCDTANKALCGDWVCFVRKKNRGLFEWRSPDYRECVEQWDGRCDFKTDVLEERGSSGWKEVRFVEGLRNLPWRDVVAVGIAVSREYWWAVDTTLGILGGSAHSTRNATCLLAELNWLLKEFHVPYTLLDALCRSRTLDGTLSQDTYSVMRKYLDVVYERKTHEPDAVVEQAEEDRCRIPLRRDLQRSRHCGFRLRSAREGGA